jgi:hypothetical protein
MKRTITVSKQINKFILSSSQLLRVCLFIYALKLFKIMPPVKVTYR